MRPIDRKGQEFQRPQPQPKPSPAHPSSPQLNDAKTWSFEAIPLFFQSSYLVPITRPRRNSRDFFRHERVRQQRSVNPVNTLTFILLKSYGNRTIGNFFVFAAPPPDMRKGSAFPGALNNSEATPPIYSLIDTTNERPHSGHHTRVFSSPTTKH
jgi:hypothetical protein